MSFPTTNLLASYEPWRWGYSDGDVFNGTTKKFQDDSGAGKHLTTVNASPVYKTGGLNSMAYGRFDGASAVTSDSFSLVDPVSVLALIIPRALGGSGFHAFCSFNNGVGPTAGQTGYHATNNKAFGYDGYNTFDGTTTLVVGTSYVITAIYSGTTQNRLRVASAEENNLSATAALPAMTKFSVGAAVGALLSNPMQVDVYALAVYGAYLHGTQTLTDAEAYLTTLKTSGPSTAYTLTVNTTAFALTESDVGMNYGPHVGAPGARGAPAYKPASVPSRVARRYYHVLEDE